MWTKTYAQLKTEKNNDLTKIWSAVLMKTYSIICITKKTLILVNNSNFPRKTLKKW